MDRSPSERLWFVEPDLCVSLHTYKELRLTCSLRCRGVHRQPLGGCSRDARPELKLVDEGYVDKAIEVHREV